jgi:hypothetical protein
MSLSGVSLGFVGAEGAGKLKVVAAFARLSGVDVAEALVIGNGTAPAAAEANSGTPGRDAMLSLGSAAGFDFGDVCSSTIAICVLASMRRRAAYSASCSAVINSPPR